MNEIDQKHLAVGFNLCFVWVNLIQDLGQMFWSLTELMDGPQSDDGAAYVYRVFRRDDAPHWFQDVDGCP